MRTTELTLRRGMWNLHDNLLVLGTPAQLATVEDTIVSRWLDAATAAGVQATKAGQYAEASDSTAAVRHYILKGLMDYAADPSRGQTPGDVLRAFYMGDADAAERWGELERFTMDHPRGLIWTQRGGALRVTAPCRADLELAA